MNVFKEIFGKEQRTISYASSDDHILKRTIINSVELMTGRRRIERVYAQLKHIHASGLPVWNYVFELLEINLVYDLKELGQIPVEGPLLIISNHPFGVADGLALGHVLSRKRDDFYIIVNEVLCREDILGRYLLPIDFSERKEAIRTNLNTRFRAIEYIQKGGAVAIFPSGGVATSPRLFTRAVDLEWKNFVLKIIKKTNADIIPVFFEGQNSTLFQVASQINLNLRLSLLLNELNNKRNKSIQLHIGSAVDRNQLRHLGASEMLAHLKTSTMQLNPDYPAD